MLELKEKIAEGSGSFVYQHPQERKRLVKVLKPHLRARSEGRFLRPHKKKFRIYREWAVEYDHYLSIVAKTDRCPPYHAHFYGFEDTTLGVGKVVEKIADEGSGEIAQTVTDYLTSGGDKVAALTLLVRFFEEIGTDQAVFRDVAIANLCLVRSQAGEPLRFVAVDGLGEFTLVPLRTISFWAYWKWHARRWAEIRAEIQAFEPGD